MLLLDKSTVFTAFSAHVSEYLTQIKMQKAAKLPSLKSVSVQNFGLYPEGLIHDFQSGVNVAIGVNGIGKTTLLRIIYRAITGAVDIRDATELGEGQRKFNVIANATSLFAPVVQDGAERATVNVVLSIGTSTLEIQRSLRTLKLINLKKDGTNILTEDIDFEEQYRLLLPQLMNVPSFFDVILILRYITFSLEDRRSIVWDSKAQVELLQIFLYPMADQITYRNAFNDAMKADSAARNYQALLSKEEKKYRSQAAKLPSIESVSQLEQAILSLRPEVTQLEATVEMLDNERKTIRSQKLRLEEDLLQKDLLEQTLREKHLAELLPELDDYGAYIISRLEHGSCLICGSSETTAISETLKRLLIEHKCPLCTANFGEANDEDSSEFSSLSELVESRKKAEVQRSDILRQEEQIRVRYSTEYKKWVEKDDELNRLSLHLKDLTSSTGATPGALLDQHKLVRMTLETQRDTYKKEKEVSIYKLKDIATQHLSQIKEFCEKMSESFNDLIGTLLAEECLLSWSINEKHVGQGATELTVPMPIFLISMTSGVFTGIPAPRHRPTDVSESQRELIDLAFRLSVIRVFAANKSVSLLTETPDDGLDVAFIPNYASVLRSAAMVSNPGSRFLVTANLNGSSLIKLLLSSPDDVQNESDRSAHVIDLLHKSAETAAVKKYGSRYESALFEATGVKK